MHRKLSLLVVATFSCGLLHPSPAVAEGPSTLRDDGQTPSNDVVRDLLAHASASLEQGAYIEATDYYRAAMDLQPSRETACNFALAARLSGSLIEAAQALAVCLAEPLPVNATDEERKRRAQFEADREVVRQQIGTIEITTAPGAKVSLDGAPLEVASPRAEVFVKPGSHTLLVEHEGRTASRTIFVGAGKRVAIERMPNGEPARPRAIPAPLPRKANEACPFIIAGSVAAGVVFGAGLLAYGASRIVSFEVENDLEEARNKLSLGCSVPSPGAHCAGIPSSWETAATLQTIGAVGLITGAVLGGGTAAYALTTSREDGPIVSAGPTGAALGWRFRW
ncbi:MAG TPA: hypothetical protein VE093_23360 [Polyangiaceae bacterium]|nr:hypothetical protein [Polyangiaceae bacterium]